MSSRRAAGVCGALMRILTHTHLIKLNTVQVCFQSTSCAVLSYVVGYGYAIYKDSFVMYPNPQRCFPGKIEMFKFLINQMHSC